MPADRLSVEVVTANLDELVDLRRRALALADPSIPEDSDAETWHLRGQVNGVTVGAISALAEVCPVASARFPLRFWGMVVEPSEQGRGVGQQLFLHLEGVARRREHDLLWANARVAVRGFYEAMGMEPIGPPFRRANTGLDHQVVVRWLNKFTDDEVTGSRGLR